MANDVKSAVKLDARPAGSLAEQITRDVAAHATAGTAQVGQAMTDSTARIGDAANHAAAAGQAATENARRIGGDFAKTLPDLRLPGLPNMQAIAEGHRRNLEALGAAHRAMAEGSQAIARRNMEIAQRFFRQVNETFGQMASSETPQARIARGADAMKRSWETAGRDVRDVQGMIQRTGDQVAEALNKRFLESVDEIKAAMEAMGSRTRPA